jgi:hypothetical protein
MGTICRKVLGQISMKQTTYNESLKQSYYSKKPTVTSHLKKEYELIVHHT